MVCAVPPVTGAAGPAAMLLRRLWALRRRWCPRPVLLSGVAICLVYQTLTVARSRFRSCPPPNEPTAGVRFGAARNQADVAEVKQNRAGHSSMAAVLLGQHLVSDTEVQLYQRVLRQHRYSVSVSRYAQTSSALRQHNSQPGSDAWALLICLRGSEYSCLKRLNSYHLQAFQRVNMIPRISQAFSSAEGLCRFQTHTLLSELSLPINPSACGPFKSPPANVHPASLEGRPLSDPIPSAPSSQGLVAMVSGYVLVTSATPLTAFLHSRGLVRTSLSGYSQPAELQTFFLEQLGTDTYLQPMDNMKEAISAVLLSAAMTSGDQTSGWTRCQLCFQLLTFTLYYSGSVHPKIVKVQGDLQFDDLKDPGFDGQILKEFILEDTLNFLLPAHPGHDIPDGIDAIIREKYGGCEGTSGLCLPEDERLLLFQFVRQLESPGPFEVLYPAASPALHSLQHQLDQRFHGVEGTQNVSHLAALLDQACSFLCTRESRGRPGRSGGNKGLRSSTNFTQNSQPRKDSLHRADCRYDVGKCVDPPLRQLYTDPPLVLTPPFSPQVKEYWAEVPFDVVTVKIRAEPKSCRCRVRLDERRGPRMANYPIGLGSSRVNILVVDESEAEPVVMTIYTLHIYRESRPSLPVFDEYIVCSFVQDCGLALQPDKPCGLEPLPYGPSPTRPCGSGDVPGRWVVPCLSCSDNRTCDWRVVSWQPDDCYYPLLESHQLQDCMMGRKVLFIGDSTNRGMMYYFVERLNGTLETWDKAHDTIMYYDVNDGRTLISYSYYPQFWLDRRQKPTFEMALQQLIERSRPLEDSPQTVLVVGGVQWLTASHLKILQQVLKREHLFNILVMVKSLGMGFHLPVDGIHSLSPRGVQDLHSLNEKILTTAKLYGYEVIDTLSITMGRYKEFLQGRCACHFHEVEKLSFSTAPQHEDTKFYRQAGETRPELGGTLALREPGSRTDSPYHVKGPVNQVYSEILLSRMCTGRWSKVTARPH